MTLGPRVDLTFVGATPPKKVQDEVRTQWHRGVFDKQRADDGVDALREWLMADNHLQPKIDYQLAGRRQRRAPGGVQHPARAAVSEGVLAFEGASGIDPDQLDKIVDQQKLERQLFTDPIVVTELLERYYREQGFLAAEIDEPRYEYQDATARVVLAVREGPKYTVRQLTVIGQHRLPDRPRRLAACR